jgi:hypothetical protein
MQAQHKTTLTRWAVGYAKQFILPMWEKHCPQDHRPKDALDAALSWLAGEIKLPAARAAILACHAAARESSGIPAAQAAARAIAHTASIVHTPKHGPGLALYGALAVAYDQLGIDTDWKTIEPIAAEECLRMTKSLQAFSNVFEE